MVFLFYNFQFIAGYFQGSICNTPQLHVSCLQRSQSTAIYSETNVEDEFELGPESNIQEQPVHLLGVLTRKTIRFREFCEIEQKWEKTSKKIDLTLPIESFRDAVMIPVDYQMFVFHMQNGIASHLQQITLENSAVETITLPKDIECAGIALFCPLNDKIYCFARNCQQFFHE